MTPGDLHSLGPADLNKPGLWINSVRLAWAGVAAMLICMVPACEEGPRTRSRSSGPIHIIVVGNGRNEPTWPVIKSVARDFGGPSRGVMIEVVAPAIASPAEQQALLGNWVEKAADVVCVHPVDSAALGPVIDSLLRAGRQVVTFGGDAPDSVRGVHVGPDERASGAAAADALALVADGRPLSVMVVGSDSGRDSDLRRLLGFQEKLGEYVSIKAVREIACPVNPVLAAARVREEARLYPRIGAWVFLSDDALQAELPEGIPAPPGAKIVLCASSPRYFESLRSGRIAALVAYNYRQTVEEAVYAAVRLMGDTPSYGGTSDTLIITRGNLDGPGGYAERWRVEPPSPDPPSRRP